MLFESKVRGGAFYKSLVVPAAFLVAGGFAHAHGNADHVDPELLTGALTWVHLSVQWTHLVAFCLWLGLTAAVLLLQIPISLNGLLYGFWILFLVLLATGSYNMEYGAGISETPSLFLLPVLEEIPYGLTYTVVLAVKVGLYCVAVFFSFVVTLLYLRGRANERKLRQAFLVGNSTLGVLLAFLTAVLLYYHEVADLWPTAVHSLGGVLGPEGAGGQMPFDPDAPVPQDFTLLNSHISWLDIVVRWLHLLAFGLLAGGMTVAAFTGTSVSVKRFSWFFWSLLLILILSGIGNMERWTPFSASPYFWNLSTLSHVRFGTTYTLLMTSKLILALMLVALTSFATWRSIHQEQEAERRLRWPYLVSGTLLVLAIGYLMMMVLLVHEGVDHAL